MSRCDDSGSCSPVRSPSIARMPRSGVTTRLVHPSPAATAPSGRATVSSARTTVVPDCDDATAPPCTALTSLAVCSETRNRSG